MSNPLYVQETALPEEMPTFGAFGTLGGVASEPQSPAGYLDILSSNIVRAAPPTALAKDDFAASYFDAAPAPPVTEEPLVGQGDFAAAYFDAAPAPPVTEEPLGGSFDASGYLGFSPTEGASLPVASFNDFGGRDGADNSNNNNDAAVTAAGPTAFAFNDFSETSFMAAPADGDAAAAPISAADISLAASAFDASTFDPSAFGVAFGGDDSAATGADIADQGGQQQEPSSNSDDNAVEPTDAVAVAPLVAEEVSEPVPAPAPASAFAFDTPLLQCLPASLSLSQHQHQWPRPHSLRRPLTKL